MDDTQPVIRPRIFQRKRKMAHLGFKKLEKKIERKEGYGKKRADAIAAAVGRKKYGTKGMAKKAAAGRKKAAKRK
jgi:hypothetical protein